MQKKSIALGSGWRFRQADDLDSEFRVTQGFPTEIYRDLLHHGLIPDPFIGKNEEKVQWVGERSWVYEIAFHPPSLCKNQQASLEFAGLDTFATIYLNDEKISETWNMFTPHAVNVTDLLQPAAKNVLRILFESAWQRSQKILEQHPEHVWAYSNGSGNRLAARKAQYHYV